MKKKINIVEYLKDCPNGMELDCTTWNNVSFIKVDVNNIYISRNDKPSSDKTVILNQYGCCTDCEDEKCRIFPKGKTTWEGFHRPFKDGDIIYVRDEYSDATFTYVAILKQIEKGGKIHSHCFYNFEENYFNIHDFLYDGHNTRFATEEEKAELFKTIKDNGYRWNLETKTLEKLIESKEDTDDKVVMSSIYINRENYANEVELHLGNYEIEIRNGKTYAIFKNQETKTLKPNFKSGDVVVDDSGAIFLYKQIHPYYEEPYADFYCELTSQFKSFKIKTGEGQHCGKISSIRLATEEEKQQLFQSIKDNGYRWNTETKTLETLVEPKFKVGDRIKHSIVKTDNIYYIVGIKNLNYQIKKINEVESYVIPITIQDDWELVLNKFDINTLKPFDCEKSIFQIGDKVQNKQTGYINVIKHINDKNYMFNDGIYIFDNEDGFAIKKQHEWRKI